MLRGLAALLALLIAAPAAAADSIPVRDDPSAVGVALSGPDIVVARSHGDRYQLIAMPRTGGAARTLLSIRGGPAYDAWAPLAASAQRVAAIVEVDAEYRLYSGPPSGPLRPVIRTGWSPELVDVDGDRVLLTETKGDHVRSEILGAGTLSWAGDRLAPVALAGRYAAAVMDTPAHDLFVVDAGSGTKLASLGWQTDGAHVDLSPDGRLIAVAHQGIASVSPGTPSRIIPNSADVTSPAFEGPAVVGVDGDVPSVLAADGSSTPLGPASKTIAGPAADAQGVAWIANGCVRYAPSAPAASTDPASCPQTEVGLYAIASSHLHGATARTIVICVAAPDGTCRGTVFGKVGKRVVARGRFAVPAGTKRWVKMRVDQATRDRYRHRREIDMIVDATVRHGRVGVGCCGDSELTVYLNRTR